jgi:peptidoglycan L-alanyl-D-glutamate endopeptidase CwlK
MPLPKPPAEVPRTTALDGLAPVFRAKVERVLEAMQSAGYDPVVFETLRTHARQQFLHGFGRAYDDGRGVVTHSADADETWHGFGLAVDVVSRSKLWGAPAEFWKKLHQCVRAEGCVSGADWDNDGVMDDWDKPHFQLGSPMRRSPSPRAARLQAEGGNAAVWAEVGGA